MFENIIKSNTNSLSSGTGPTATTTQPQPGTSGTSTTGTGTSPTGAEMNSQITNSTLIALASLVEQAAKPDGMARLLSVAAPPTAVPSQDVADLQASVRELQRMVAEQGAAIDRLTPRG